MPDSTLNSLTAKTAGAAALLYGAVSPYTSGLDRKVAMSAVGAVLLEAATAEAQRTALGLGTMATQAASAVAITGGTLAGITGLALRDTGAAFDLTLRATGTGMSAPRTITFNCGNVDHTIAYGTTANTITFPNAASFTVAGLGIANVFTAAQTIAGPVGASALTITGGTQTTSFPLLNLSQTWNGAGQTFTAFDLNITNTASDASNGQYLAKFRIGAAGKLFVWQKGIAIGDSIANAASTGCAIAELTAGTMSVGRYDGYNTISGGSTVMQWATNAANIAFPGAVSIGTTYASRDVILERGGAGILAQRNGANAQISHTYGTYTDTSNYVRLALNTTSTTMGIACETAGTGADDIDLSLTPAGTGNVRFGTHSAVGVELITGYITIKDAGGTSRKIAVIS